tara:strand:- start:5125 stop:5742 length:618 start_codon:yes stop_codon:yes gene_type:complete
MKSYSQIKQDLYVLEYFKYKKNGFFVDIGANNPIELNNTYLLETDYNWNGICIEPSKSEALLLEEKRKAKVVNLGVYDKDTIIEFESSHVTMMGGIKKHLQPKYRSLGGKEEDWKTFKIHVKPLVNILDQYKAPIDIDYISVDTEGSEYNILSGYFRDNKKYKVKYWDIEHAYNHNKQKLIRELMFTNGYTLLRQNQYDDTFIFK